MKSETAILDGLAPLLRVRPELQSICRFGAQWASPHEPEMDGWAPFHIVTSGACRLETPTTVLTLARGDVAMLPHGGPHTIRALPEAGESVRPVRSQVRAFDSVVVKTNIDGDGECGLICGRFQFEQANHNTVLAALPSLVVISASDGCDAERIAALIEAMQGELLDDRIGAATVATSLAAAVMVIMLRSHFRIAAPQHHGVLALLTRRQTATALLGMLREPARPWTLDHLAEHANTSRATLVRHFQAAVNMAPVAFLAELRLTIARSRIQASRTPLAVIAEDVGYQSETAFSRAYQRQFGRAPSGDRATT